MIVYQLLCENGHEFEGWFQSSTAFDEQVAAGDVECPHCASCNVTKGIMSPNIATKGAITASEDTKDKLELYRNRMEVMASKVRNHVEENFDYVGGEFPEEARRIHYGEAEDRGIYGEATPEETQDLIDEGVEVMPLPGRSKKDAN